MKVNEIFYSIEGEGVRAGLPCVFIRLFGCNLNCSYCDTRYACVGKDYEEMSIKEIMTKVKSFGCPCVTVTGGEPLIHEDIVDLLEELVSEHYFVNVETNGSIVPPILAKWLFYTMDYKTNASGMSNKMNIDAFQALGHYDVIKFVVGSIADLNQAVKFYKENDIKAIAFVSPVFGQIEPKEIAEYLKKNGLHWWKVQLQLHKYIWSPQERGV